MEDGLIESVVLILSVIGAVFLYIWAVNSKKKRDEETKKRIVAEYIHPDFPQIETESMGRIELKGNFYYKNADPPNAGDLMALVREPDNKYDSDAIAVMNLKGQKIGHLPADSNRELAEKMDQGLQVYSQIKKSLIREEGRDIKLEVYKIKEET